VVSLKKCPRQIFGISKSHEIPQALHHMEWHWIYSHYLRDKFLVSVILTASIQFPTPFSEFS
jgi:hypothetical protein